MGTFWNNRNSYRLIILHALKGGGGGGGGGGLWGGSARGPNSYTIIPSIEEMVPLSHTNSINAIIFIGSVPDILRSPFKHLNDSFPCLFIYLRPEEGTHFGWTHPIQSIIGSTPTRCQDYMYAKADYLNIQ